MSRAWPGFFITFEGGEGSGKTTQIHALHNHLTARGHTCLLTREPGGCPSAEAIRHLLLTGSAEKWHPLAETLMFQAARVEHMERVVKPALARGEIVLCDRFLDSTIVYQGVAKGLGEAFIRRLHALTLPGMLPDVTLLLDLPPETGLARAQKRAGDETRFESLGVAFHTQVSKGFLALAQAEPERFAVIDAATDKDAVTTAVLQAVNRHMKV